MPRTLALGLALPLLLGGCQEYEYAVYEQVDVFFQNPPPQVDLLLVIDNSGSMAGYQALVAARFDELREWLVEAEVDYHIGVVTTTIERPYTNEYCSSEDIDEIPPAGHLHKDTFMTPETEEARTTFADLVAVGICGSAGEKGLEVARIALSPELVGPGGANERFIRQEASLSILFVSDEQDQSAEPVAHYVNDFYQVKGARSRDVFNASALVVTDTEDCILPAVGSSVGSRYVAAAEMTGGAIANLCNTNFIDTMAEVSRVASRLRDTFLLSDTPNPATFEVVVDGEVQPCESGTWTYTKVLDGEVEVPAVVFGRDDIPGPGDQVVVRYDLGTGDPAEFCPPAQEAP